MVNQIKIVTDSAADLPREEIESLGIQIAPLYIQFPEGEVSSDDISADEFYDRLQALSPRIPTTSMPSLSQFAEIYRRVAQFGEQVLSLHVSSGLSGTLNTARLGAEQSGAQVEVVDTMTLSGGERFQVLAAALAAKLGWSVEAILEQLGKIRAATEVIYTLDTLKYLQHGGRIGRVQSLVASLLKIKPVIKVDKTDGKYTTANKGRSIAQALNMIVDYLRDVYSAEQALWVSVMHGQFAEQAAALARLAQERLNVARLEVLRISPVLGVHTGPGIVGIAAMPMSLMQDLV